MATAYSRVNKIVYIERDDYYEGVLPSGRSFFIDKEDYEFVSTNYWHSLSGKELYLKSTKHGFLHRYLLKDKLNEKLQVDHINRNRLDNRRSNLRIVTQAENLHNKSRYKSNKSGYPGVKWNKRLEKWQAQITRNGVRRHLGVFNTKHEAIVARKLAE
jgi:hypothetical protein